ncbi:MAG: hypothetical protein KAI29_09250, partial [Cyclobacteriaceae bacterium]|nr:hypothetical protein [Cyclobacteriaceae bacterium]
INTMNFIVYGSGVQVFLVQEFDGSGVCWLWVTKIYLSFTGFIDGFIPKNLIVFLVIFVADS